MLDIFLKFFTDIWNIVFALLFVLIGMLLGILAFRYFRRQKNQILYCRERDGRGLELDIAEEDAVSIETNTKPRLRFFKYGRSYEFPKRGRSYTRFLGKEGTAYTWRLEGFEQVPTKFQEVPDVIEVPDGQGGMTKQSITKKIPIEFENKKVTLEFDTLEDAVIGKWGDKYQVVPPQLQALLRDDKVLLTVGLEPGIVPEGYEPITENVIHRKGDEGMAKLIGESAKLATKKDMFERIAWIGVGLAIGFGMHVFGIF